MPSNVGIEVTRTGGREATNGVIPGCCALSVGKPPSTPPPGWRWIPLCSVARLESGHTPSRQHPEYWNGDIPWIGIRDATENHGRTIFDTHQHTTPAGIENSSARVLPAGTVCLSRTASVGFVVVMGRPMATSQDFVNWVCSEAIDYRFLKYVLLAERDSMLRFASGTTHQTIYYPEAKAFHVCLPPVLEQRAIASILGALDDKIELNRRMNETLEGLARALFKSWFEPQTLPRVSAAELIDSGVLEIGDGYRAKNTELGSPGLPFVRAADLNGGFDTDGAAVLHNDSVSRAGSKVSRLGDVAFTSKGTIGRIARVGPYVHPFVYSPQVCYWRTLDSSRLAPAVLYCWMSTDDFRRQVDVVADQTDMAPYVSLRDQRAMRVPIFGEAQHVLDRQVAPLLARVSTNVAQSRTLAALRDALLPKLLSGELRVRDAERAVETAT